MTTATYNVQGMTCDHCAGAVSAEVSKLDGVTGVSVDVTNGTVTVTSDQPMRNDAVVDAVDEAGYAVVSS